MLKLIEYIYISSSCSISTQWFVTILESKGKKSIFSFLEGFSSPLVLHSVHESSLWDPKHCLPNRNKSVILKMFMNVVPRVPEVFISVNEFYFFCINPFSEKVYNKILQIACTYV